VSKKIKLNRRKDIPPIAISLYSTLSIKTGTWRYFSPLHQNKIPPCNDECPIRQDVRGFIEHLTKNRFDNALSIIRKDNPFPGVTGRVCYHPCQTVCNREFFDGYVSIAALERAASDFGQEKKRKKIREKNKRIAIVGGGPSGLTCAYHLRTMGYQATVFEALPVLGGMLRTGIPDYRLPKEVLDREIRAILDLGVEVKTDTRIGKDVEWKELEEKYDALFIATGAHLNKRLDVPGENLGGVISGVAFLRDINLGNGAHLGERVVIIGGGNTAFDAARTALRQGSKATIIYRRTQDQIPAYIEEVEQGIEEEVEILYLTMPIRISKNGGSGLTVECLKAELGEADDSGRKRPVPIPGSNFFVETDNVITAIGEDADLSYLPEKVKCHRGIVVTNEKGGSSSPNIFAGGDATDQPRTVAHAIGSGKRAALSIDEALRKRSKKEEKGLPVVEFEHINQDYFEKQERIEAPILTPLERRKNSKEIKAGLTKEMAVKEAERCFSCGVCNKCGNCLIYCPDLAVEEDLRGYSVLYDYCKGCGICMVECPRGVITMEKEKEE
jgi:NADPH-dependent glutamate synthase beta subunit-like oxidoreductase